MAVVTNPTFKNTSGGNAHFGEKPLRADATTAKKYLEETGLGTYSSFTSGDPVFSNNYGYVYQYYVSGGTYTDYWLNTGVTYDWRTEFGYYPVITSITYS